LPNAIFNRSTLTQQNIKVLREKTFLILLVCLK